MPTDWQKEWRYLEARGTVPSPDDLYNSLRNTGMDKVQAAALAELFCVMFRRIKGV